MPRLREFTLHGGTNKVLIDLDLVAMITQPPLDNLQGPTCMFMNFGPNIQVSEGYSLVRAAMLGEDLN